MKVSQRMTPEPITVTRDTSYREASDLMKKHDIRRLPVLDGQGKLIGMVSETDILSTGPSSASTLSVYEMVTLLDKLKIDKIMSAPVYAVDSDCEISRAAMYMIEKEIGALCVMEGDELVGIITETDIFKAFVEAVGGGIPGLRIDLLTPNKPGILAKVGGAISAMGGNIIALTTFQHPDEDTAEITIKSDMVDIDQLRTNLTEVVDAEILDLRPAGKDKLRIIG